MSDDEEDLPVPISLPVPVASICLEEDVEDENEEEMEECVQPEGNWVRAHIFEPLPPAPELEVSQEFEMVAPLERVSRYIGNDFFSTLSEYSNRKYLKDVGRSLNATELEIKIFIGAVIIMSYLKYPWIKMYRARKTRVAQIADKITRNRFLQIRNYLKLIDDAEATPEEKASDKYWKLKPLLHNIRQACLNSPRSSKHSIDEQMIPFWGHVQMSQYVKGKPNPRGLKNFVCTASDGLPVDFFLYEGKGSTILEGESYQNLDIGGKAVLRLSRSLPAGSTVYMDRFFTSVHLLDLLHADFELQGTGTLQKNRIPTDNFKTDVVLKREGRGSHDMMVRDDGQVAIVKWFDSKSVVLASSVEGVTPVTPC